MPCTLIPDDTHYTTHKRMHSLLRTLYIESKSMIYATSTNINKLVDTYANVVVFVWFQYFGKIQHLRLYKGSLMVGGDNSLLIEV